MTIGQITENNNRLQIVTITHIVLKFTDFVLRVPTNFAADGQISDVATKFIDPNILKESNNLTSDDVFVL